jgi:membrane-associated protease RseP (regulator of RpoE activity)
MACLTWSPWLIGIVIGLVFGAVDLLITWIAPLQADTVGALLRFYGPMFLVWAIVAHRAAWASRRPSQGVAAGTAVAFATFCVFVALNFLRVNLFLVQLTARADWQDMMMRFDASGSHNLRAFVNLDYLRGTPVKIGAATVLGMCVGVLGAAAAWLNRLSPARPRLTGPGAAFEAASTGYQPPSA